VVSAAATFPLEVTRRRMMAGAGYPNFVAALLTIARVEGVSALFNGMLLSLMKQGPAVAITMAAFEVSSGGRQREACVPGCARTVCSQRP
jgi:hypothetical protein